MWGETEYTDEFGEWWQDITEAEQEAIVAAVEFLEEHGPGLGRPFVDGVKTSRHKNMKELIPRGKSIRILFAFDPMRNAILFISGDKRDRWRDWYRETVPRADDLYDEHLKQLRAEGSI